MSNTQDTELHDLCKQVYESTGWDDDSLKHYLGGNIHQKRLFESDIYLNNTTEDTYVPLYNSDYLLEKLPKLLPNGDMFELTPTMAATRWNAGYYGDSRLRSKAAYDESPLKALLKLCLILKKDGLL